MLAIGKSRPDIEARRIGQKDQGPHPRRRKFNQTDAAERRSALGEQGLENLFQAFVERPHDRHAVKDVFTRLHQLAPDEICGEEPEQRQAHECQDKPETGILTGRYVSGR